MKSRQSPCNAETYRPTNRGLNVRLVSSIRGVKLLSVKYRQSACNAGTYRPMNRGLSVIKYYQTNMCISELGVCSAGTYRPMNRGLSGK